MPDNRIRSMLQSKIDQLLSQLDGAGNLDDGSTVGRMREKHLKDFLRSALPAKFEPVSGFVVDAFGHASPQLDMLFFDRSGLPTFTLEGDNTLVPFEAALLTIEVKSTLEQRDLDQLRRQQQAFRSMEAQFLGAGAGCRKPEERKRRNYVALFLVCYSSRVPRSHLQRWVEKRCLGYPSGVLVLSGKDAPFSLFHNPLIPEGSQVVSVDTCSSGGSEHEPVLAFVGVVYRCLDLLLELNSPLSDAELDRHLITRARWVWESYLSETVSHMLAGFRP